MKLSILPFALVGGLMFPVLFAACNETSIPDDEVPSLRAMTFNTALGEGLAPYTSERRDAIVAALVDLDNDVVCLQEVWAYADVQRLEEKLTETYAHSFYSVTPSQSEVAGCSSDEAALLLGCLEQHCADESGDALLLCAVDSCAEAFAQVSAPCQSCVVANQDTPLDELLTICESDNAPAFDAQNGLMLLSRFPFVETEFFPLESSFGERGVLRARIAPPGSEGIDVYCTHLAAEIGADLYTGPYGSWAKERSVQAAALLEWVEVESSGVADVLILGDLNCGPKTAEVPAEDSDSFELFIDANFTSAYTGFGQSACSWCAENTLTAGSDSMLIDHVLWRSQNPSSILDAGRALDRPVDLDAAGDPIRSNLSDHFAVWAESAYTTQAVAGN